MLVYYTSVFKLHIPPYRHPEAPDRLDFLLKGVEEAGGVVVEPRLRDDVWSLIALAHDASYIDYIKKLCREEAAVVDGDTYVSKGTCDAASTAVSAAVEAVDKKQTALIASRPPGHHAGVAGRALTAPTQGFCIFNTAAIAALYRGEGVAVLDIDVHHGNGTQEILYDRDLLYISIHQDPNTLYPGTGFPDEVGRGRGEGYNVNIPLPPHTGDDVYIKVFEDVVMPIVRQYAPGLVIVSLGWDAHREDPLAQLELSLKSYLYVFDSLLKLQIPLVVVLEGGYNREVIKKGTYALIKLVDRGVFTPGESQTTTQPHVLKRAESIVSEVKRHVGRFWRL
ncbi:MAG: histone deacetylase family protein [Pyrobaculum sp.]